MTYRLFVDFEVIDFLNSLKKRERHMLWRRIEDIWKSPHAYSDRTTKDRDNREIDVHLVAGYAIFWIDAPDRDVKILEILRV